MDVDLYADRNSNGGSHCAHGRALMIWLGGLLACLAGYLSARFLRGWRERRHAKRMANRSARKSWDDTY